jgi:hypothetical protein
MTARSSFRTRERIPLPRGRQLVTLEDAARYIQKLPKAEQQIEEWQTAVEALILVAESNGGPTMLARIGRHSSPQGRADHSISMAVQQQELSEPRSVAQRAR